MKSDTRDRRVEGDMRAINISGNVSADITKEAISVERHMNVLRAAIGGVICILGAVLLWAGVAGEADWFFSGLGLESRISKASPGVVALVLGFLLVYSSRPKITIKR